MKDVVSFLAMMAFAGFVYLCLPSRVKEGYQTFPLNMDLTDSYNIDCSKFKTDFDSMDDRLRAMQKELVENIKTYNEVKQNIDELKALAKNANC
jgi:hypothetical protein